MNAYVLSCENYEYIILCYRATPITSRIIEYALSRVASGVMRPCPGEMAQEKEPLARFFFSRFAALLHESHLEFSIVVHIEGLKFVCCSG